MASSSISRKLHHSSSPQIVWSYRSGEKEAGRYKGRKEEFFLLRESRQTGMVAVHTQIVFGMYRKGSFIGKGQYSLVHRYTLQRMDGGWQWKSAMEDDGNGLASLHKNKIFLNFDFNNPVVLGGLFEIIMAQVKSGTQRHIKTKYGKDIEVEISDDFFSTNILLPSRAEASHQYLYTVVMAQATRSFAPSAWTHESKGSDVGYMTTAITGSTVTPSPHVQSTRRAVPSSSPAVAPVMSSDVVRVNNYSQASSSSPPVVVSHSLPSGASTTAITATLQASSSTSTTSSHSVGTTPPVAAVGRGHQASSSSTTTPARGDEDRMAFGWEDTLWDDEDDIPVVKVTIGSSPDTFWGDNHSDNDDDDNDNDLMQQRQMVMRK